MGESEVLGYAVFSDEGENPEERPIAFVRRGDWLHLRGGPTGYESAQMRGHQLRDWTACVGTKGRWERCVVPARELNRALDQLFPSGAAEGAEK